MRSEDSLRNSFDGMDYLVLAFYLQCKWRLVGVERCTACTRHDKQVVFGISHRQPVECTFDTPNDVLEYPQNAHKSQIEVSRRWLVRLDWSS